MFLQFSNCLLCALSGLKLASSWLKFSSSWLKLGSSWLKLGSSWLKLASSWLKLASSWPKMASCCLELAQVGLKFAPSWLQVGSKLVQVGPKISSGSLQEGLLEVPGRVQGGSWEAPRGPPGSPRGAKMASRWFQNYLKVIPALSKIKQKLTSNVSDLRDLTR